MPYIRKDGTQAIYDNKAASAKYYAKTSAEEYTCHYCRRTIKLVSKLAHERTKGHVRAIVIADQCYDKGLTRLTPVVSDSEIKFIQDKAARNRDESPIDRDAQNAYYECYRRGITPTYDASTVLA